MRGVGTLLLLLLLAASASAVPARLSGSPTDAGHLTDSGAVAYARDLISISEQIIQRYVRPVAEADLLTAALMGLYEAANVPVPFDLASELRKSSAARHELLHVVTAHRLRVGDPPALQNANALFVSCRAMARALDPYCGIVTGNDRRAGEDHLGVGLEFADKAGRGPLVLRAVLPGSPAQRVGLRPGDSVSQINGKSTDDMAPEPTLLWLNGIRSDTGNVLIVGEASGKFTLVVRRGERVRTVTLSPQEYVAESVLGYRRQPDNGWDYFLDRQRKIGFLRITTLGRATPEELEKALTEMRNAGARGLLLDLRWCPGGYLDPSVAAAELFLGDGIVATLKSRSEPERVYKSTTEQKFLDFPLVVLVNGETMGGAELIAASLQDNGRGVIVGQRTFGKASVQRTDIVLRNTSALFKLTTGTFVRPSGKGLHRFPDSKPADDWGVRPNARMEFRVSPELSRQLKDGWTLHALRPGTERDVLPFDDPTNDPQLAAALRILSQQMQ
jgi:carboxyl-terminal processing protease